MSLLQAFYALNTQNYYILLYIIAKFVVVAFCVFLFVWVLMSCISQLCSFSNDPALELSALVKISCSKIIKICCSHCSFAVCPSVKSDEIWMEAQTVEELHSFVQILWDITPVRTAGELRELSEYYGTESHELSAVHLTRQDS